MIDWDWPPHEPMAIDPFDHTVFANWSIDNPPPYTQKDIINYFRDHGVPVRGITATHYRTKDRCGRHFLPIEIDG